MNMRIYPWIVMLATLIPGTAQAQSTPNLQTVPPNVSVGRTISGVITAKDYSKIVNEFGPIKCSQIKVTLQDKNPGVTVQGQGTANTAPNPTLKVTTKKGAGGQPGVKVEPQVESPAVPQILLFQETVPATGNNLGLGCKYSVTVPQSALGLKTEDFTQAYLWAHVEGHQWLIVSPTGWQNPLPLPSAGFRQDMGRNFLVDVQAQIK